ncbi:7TM domain-containing protein [Aquimarina hainanensis]|uniref:7TM domain-containing protein n=1 Tax=Aquimarina hainanensis TaxID=1578017 RepID=A0ABW5N798_9FLAO
MSFKTNIVLLMSILIVVVVSISFKLDPILKSYDAFNAEEVYTVTYDYFLKSSDANTYVKTYLPQTNDRQRISVENVSKDSTLVFSEITDYKGNNRGHWETELSDSYYSLNYEFTFEGKAKEFSIPANFSRDMSTDAEYLRPGKYIQSDDDRIKQLAIQLGSSAKNDKERISAYYEYVLSIPSAPIITLTDALTAIEQNRASCNGKSRLFVALCRSAGYAARIKGGIILQNVNKRVSHVWAELWINKEWVPFDALNNHYAYVPSNYLEIYNGDEFLITHTPRIQFDYEYQIKKVYQIPFFNMTSDELKSLTGFTLWSLIEGNAKQFPIHLLLLLPIGGLLVAFLKNIVGIKTFGVFLPVLIAFSLMKIGVFVGVLSLIALILCVGLVSYPFDRMGLLYTPKLVISLVIIVSIMIGAIYIGMKNEIPWLTTFATFPIIILTITSERFSRTIIEEGYRTAIDRLLQTLLATVICYVVVSRPWLPSVLIVFPELILLVIVASTCLGRYIGIRWVEFYRFRSILN